MVRDRNGLLLQTELKSLAKLREFGGQWWMEVVVQTQDGEREGGGGGERMGV
jgi:hypothetical protein